MPPTPIALAGIMLLGSCLFAQSQLVSTSTDMHVSVSDDGRRQMLQVIGKVSASGHPVVSGELTLRWNGQAIRSEQIVGQHAAPGHDTGTAIIRLPVRSGAYRLSMTYSGTTKWGASATPTQTVNVPSLSVTSWTAPSVGAGTNNPDGGNIAKRAEDGAAYTSTAKLRDAKALAQTLKKPTYAKAQINFSVGYSPSCVIVADLLSVGGQDLIVADSAQGTIKIYLQGPIGDHYLAQTIRVGRNPVAILARDFNQDGLIDIAALNQDDGTVTILVQDDKALGHWKDDPSPTLVGGLPVSFAAGDFNHDGFLDLAVANFGDNTIAILQNQESAPGKLSLDAKLTTPNGPVSIIAGNLLGRNEIDLAVANYYDGTIAIFSRLSDSSSFSQQPLILTVGSGPRRIAAADLNDDGLLDIVVANALDGTLSVLLADSSQPSGFQLQRIEEGFKTPIVLAFLLNVERVGASDILVGDGTTGDLVQLHNDGVSRFPIRRVWSPGSTASDVSSMWSTDMLSEMVVVADSGLGVVHLLAIPPTITDYTNPTTQRTPSSSRRGAAGEAASTSAQPSPSTAVSGGLLQKKDQTITFPRIGIKRYGFAPLLLTASASSNLPVRFVIKSGGRLDGSVLSANSAGPILIEADQDGNAQFEAAPPISQTVYVMRADLVIAPVAATRKYGSPNPAFSGQLLGLMPGDIAVPTYVSGASTSAPPGTYSQFPFGITGSIQDPILLSKYYVSSQVGALTICPSSTPLQTPLAEFSAMATTALAATQSNLKDCAFHPIVPLPPSPAPPPTPIPDPTPVSPSPAPNPVEPSPKPPIVIPLPIIPSPAPGTPIGTSAGNASSAAAHVIPIPIPVPVLRHITPEPPAASSLQLALAPHSSLIPGWIEVNVQLKCLNHPTGDRTVLLRVGNNTIGHMSVESGSEKRSWVAIGDYGSASLTAYFEGDRHCMSAGSNSVRVIYPQAPDLPLGEQPATVYLIPNEPLPQWITGRLAIGSQSLLFDSFDEELETSSFECGLKWTDKPE